MKQPAPTLIEIFQAISRIDDRLATFDDRFTAIDNRFSAIDDRIANTKTDLLAAISRAEDKLRAAISQSQDEVIDTIRDVIQIASEKHDDHERRIVKLECAALPPTRTA
jgi:hypothetical protein